MRYRWSFLKWSNEYIVSSYRGMSTAQSLSHTQKLKVLKNAYLCEGKYKSSVELANDLARNIVYYDHKREASGLIVVNKPAGVPLKTSKDSIGLVDAMPELSQLLGLEKIHIVKSVQKLASGCVLLASKEQGINQIRRSLNRSWNDLCLNESYYALTYGNPRKSSVNETVDVLPKDFGKFRDPLTDKKISVPVIGRNLVSNRQLEIYRKDPNVKRITVNAQAVSKSVDGQNALVRIEPTSVQNSFLSVYCADLLSPIIGDHQYGYRAKMLLGKMVKVDPHLLPDASSNHQNLPSWLLSKLGLKSYEEHILPIHLHLGRVHLPGYFGGSTNLTVHAPPRPYFIGTAEMLDLNLPSTVFQDEEVRRYTQIRKRIKQKNPAVTIFAPDDDVENAFSNQEHST